jgi:hypothetical protein
MARKPRTGSDRGRGMVADGRSRRDGERFICVAHRMITCPAYLALSGDALKVLLSIWALHNGANNGAVGYAIGDAQQAIRCGRRRACELLGELEALRFIQCSEPAAMLGRRSRRWTITEEPLVPDGKPSYAARTMSTADVEAALAGLKAGRRAAREGSRGQAKGLRNGLQKNGARFPIGTDIVSPLEPQTVPKCDQGPLRFPIGTANGTQATTLRFPVGTSLRSTIPSLHSGVPAESESPLHSRLPTAGSLAPLPSCSSSAGRIQGSPLAWVSRLLRRGCGKVARAVPNPSTCRP